MRVFVTGASGFVGRNVVDALVAAGHSVVALVRKPTPVRESIHYVIGSITDDTPDTLAKYIEGCDAIVHLVGIIVEIPSQGQTFERVHVEGTRTVLQAVKRMGESLKRFVYISAIGAAPDGPSEYSRTKATAEHLVQRSLLPYTIFRPSIIMGKKAEFLKQIEQLVQKPPLCPFPLPFIPVPGNGQNRFQPLHIDDLTRCITHCLTDQETANTLYEIGGADEVTFDELVAAVGEKLGYNKSIIHIPLPPMYVAAAVLEAILPHPPITTDQLPMLSRDNTCDNSAIKTAFQFSPQTFPELLRRCYNN